MFIKYETKITKTSDSYQTNIIYGRGRIIEYDLFWRMENNEIWFGYVKWKSISNNPVIDIIKFLIKDWIRFLILSPEV